MSFRTIGTAGFGGDGFHAVGTAGFTVTEEAESQTVAIAPAMADWAAVAPTVDPGELTAAIEPAPGTWSGVPVTVELTGGQLAVTPATADWQAVAPALSAGEVSAAVAAAVASWSGEPVIVELGAVQVAVVAATSAWEAVEVAIEAGLAPSKALPDGVVSGGGWTREDGSTANLDDSIDESPPDDADYIQTPPTGQAIWLVSWTPD